MLFSVPHLIVALVVLIMIAIEIIVFHKKIGKGMLLVAALLFCWTGVFSVYLSGEMIVQTEHVTVTAVGASRDLTDGNSVIVSGFAVDGEDIQVTYPIEGQWAWYEIQEGTGRYCVGWIPDNENQPETATDSVVLDIPVGKNRSIIFMAYPWCGDAQVELNGVIQSVQTSGEDSSRSLPLPNSSPERFIEGQWASLPYSIIMCAILAAIIFVMQLYITRKERLLKLEKYRFLFSELIKRDFTLKYKRTALGMLWSIISPLINLVIMWLVFQTILGSSIQHFVIYLFAGQLIYSYFCDATNQGMSSLLDNSSIFTKVNVPKYMFLLSKNVSSLINFGITSVILFIFVAIEGLPFNCKYFLLLFPIGCLILFNIGLGLMLSALNVFFRDMQYLWGILTQLIMWLSAIFYSIDSYPQLGQNLFLLNPVYLFIRYFRKIIIENSVPTLWFHLMIVVYTVLALIIGAKMYKKYNHEFLYYV